MNERVGYWLEKGRFLWNGLLTFSADDAFTTELTPHFWGFSRRGLLRKLERRVGREVVRAAKQGRTLSVEI